MAKQKNINVRVDHDEYDAVTAAAERTGRTRSDFVRQMLRLKVQRTRKDGSAIKLWKIERSLRFLVRHVNQAQHDIHTARLEGTISANHYADLKAAIQEAMTAANAAGVDIREVIDLR